MTMILDHHTLLCRRNVLRYNDQKNVLHNVFLSILIVCLQIPFSKNSHHIEIIHRIELQSKSIRCFLHDTSFY